MKRENNFYYIFVIVCFIISFITSYILTCRTVEVGALISTAAVFVYPITYFLATLYTEKYGKDKLFNMLMFSIFALVVGAGIISICAILPTYNGNDNLTGLFDVNYRCIFSFITAFLISQIINIKIYYFLDKNKSMNFLVSSVISVTINCIVFIFLAHIGEVSLSHLLDLMAGEFVLSIFSTIIYTFCFSYLISSVIKSKKKNEDLEKIILEREESLPVIKKTSTAKKTNTVKKTTTTKQTTSKKETTTKKSTTKTKQTKKEA